MKLGLKLFTVILMAACGWVAQAQTSLYSNGSLQVEVTGLNPCNGTNNGSIRFRVLQTGDGLPATLDLILGPVSLFSDQSIPVGSSFTFSGSGGLPIGDYDFILLASTGPDIINTLGSAPPVTLTALPTLTANAVTTLNNTDCGVPNGQAVADVTGGSLALIPGPASFSYSWTSSNGLINPTPLTGTFDGVSDLDLEVLLSRTGLPGGTYTLQISDNFSSCTSSVSFVLTDPSPTLFAITPASGTVCAGTNFSVTLSGSESGGTVYEILRNGSSLTTPLTFTGTGAIPFMMTFPTTGFSNGDVLTVLARNGACTPRLMSGSVVLNLNPSPTSAVLSGAATICEGQSTNISVAITGGTSPYSFTITGLGLRTGYVSGTPISVSPTTTTTYTLTGLVTDANGCTVAGTGSATVTVNPRPTITLGTFPNVCRGTTSGSLPFTATTGSPNQYSIVYSSAAITAGFANVTNQALAVGSIPLVVPSTAPVAVYSASLTVRNSITGCVSTVVPINITIVALPPAPTVSGTTICSGGTAVLTPSAGGTTYNFYASSTGGTPLTGGAGVTSFTTPALATTTTYHVSSLLSGCESATRTAVTVTVNALPPAPTVSGTTICSGGTAVLTPSAGGTTYNFYANSTGGTPLTGGAGVTSFTTPALTTTTTYHVSSLLAGCESATRAAVTVTVNVLPPAPTVSGTTICSGGTSVLTPSAGGTTYNFYANSTGGSPLTGGAGVTSFTTPALTTTTTYHVSSLLAGCESATRTAVTVTVNALPPAPTVSGTTICSGGTSVLTPSAGGTTYNFYANSTGGTPLTGGAGVTSFTTPALTTTTTYHVSSLLAGCESATRAAVTVTVNALPPAPTVSGTTICSGGTSVLTPSAGGTTYNFYANSTGGVPLAGGAGVTSFTTPALTTTTIYHVSSLLAGCESATRTAVTVTVNVLPPAPTVSGTTICSGGTAVLTPSAGGTTYNFYANSTGGSPLTGGAGVTSFTTPALTTTTTYHVSSLVAGCESATRTAVTVTVNALPPAPTVSGTTICSGGTAVLTPSAGGTTYNFYANSTGGSPLTGGAGVTSFTTPALTTTTTYHVSSLVAGCESATRTAVTVTVALPVAPTISDVSICSGGTAVLTPSAGGTTYNFYANSTGGSPLTGGAGVTSFTTPALTTTTTYHVSSLVAGCESASRTAVTVTVNALPPAPTVSGTTICSGGTAVLTPSAGGTTYNFYANSTGGSPLTGGAGVTSFTTPALTTTTTYHVSSLLAGCESATRTAVTVTVNVLPPAPTVSGTTICSGGTAVLTPSAGGTTYNFYANSTGGSPLTGGAGVTSFTTPALTATTTYHVSSLLLGCESATRTAVTVTVNVIPPAPTVSGTTICSGGTAVLTPSAGGTSYNFYANSTGGSPLTGGAGVTSFTTPALTTTTTYHVSSLLAGCESATRTAVTVTVNALPPAPTVSGTTICSGGTAVLTPSAGGTTYNFYANSTGGSPLTGGAGVISFTTPALTTTTTYHVSSLLAGCESATRTAVTVTVNVLPPAPTVSGTTICSGGTAVLTPSAGGTTYNFYANSTGGTPLTGGAGVTSFTTPALTTTTTYHVSSLLAGCESATRTAVTITVNGLPTTSTITGLPSVCENTTAVVYAVTNTAGSSYAWTITGGTQATGTTTNSITVNWGVAGAGSVSVVETNAAGCVGAAISLPVTVSGNPTVADAGPDQTNVACTATLAGNAPAVGTGQWVFATGGNTDGLGVIVAPANRQSNFNGTPGVTYTLQWRISNAGCTPSTDNVSIGFDPNGVTPAQAGTDQSACASGSFALAANAPTVGTGAWSIVGAANGATITTPSSATSGVTGLQGGASVTLRWTITNSTCSSFDDVVLTHVLSPTVANAGADAEVCGSTATLTANSPTVGTGFWTIVSGTGGTLATPTSSTSNFSGVRGSTYVLRWTITNGACPASTDDVQIVFNQDASVSNAGPDQTNVCGTVTLAANTATEGTGSWSFAPANTGVGGVIVTPSSATSAFNGNPGETYILRWTIANGACISTDDIQIQFDPIGVSAANAGTDQNPCGTTATLAANVPAVGVGQWSFAPGGNPDGLGLIADVANPASSFSGTINVTYQLTWSITAGACSSSDVVSISFAPNPTTANAGADVVLCNTGTFTLAGNVPTIGIGAWSVVSGTATIVTPAQATSSVTGIPAGTSATLRWTISNGSCTSSTDDVVLTNTAPPSVANAGADLSLCPGPGFVLAATNPTVGVGAWSLVSGTATIADPGSPTSAVTGVAVGTSVTLRWTVTNGICPASTDDVQLSLCTGGGGTGTCATVVITPLPSPATCTNSDGRIVFRIRPFVPAINPDGVKISITGVSPTNQTISRTNFNDSTFNNLPIGTYDYVIEYGSAACTKTGEVTIDRSGTVGVPTATNIISPLCFGESTGALTLDVPGETGNVLQWSFDGGITDPWKDFTAGNQVSGIPAGPSPSFQRVISVRRNASDPCFSAVIVTIPETATAITANLVPTNASCSNNDGTLAVTGLPAGTLTFRLNGNPIALPTNGVISNLSANTYTLRVTTATGCFKDFSAVVSFPGFVPTTTPVISPPDCTGGGVNGSISFSITTPGSYAIGYTQDPITVPDSFFNPGSLNVVIPNLTSGFWYVWIRPAGVFCETKLGPFNLAGTVPVSFQLEVTDEICFGSNGSIQLTAIRGAQNLPFSYELIKDGTALPSGSITFTQSVAAFSIPALAPGAYRIQLAQNQSSLVAACTAPILSAARTFTITGPSRALDTLYVQREISLPDQPTGSMRIGIQESTFEPYEVRVELITPVFPSQNFLMDWRAAARNAQTLRMEMVVNNLYAGVYKVSLRDARGCEKEYNVEVKVDTNLFVPNIFTPNGDGFNDTFFIRNLPAEANLEVTNRWGKSVFQSASYQNDWNANGISEGLYFYRLSFGGQAVTGWVEILRGN